MSTEKIEEEFSKMRKAGRFAASVLDLVGKHIRPGVTTGELNRICRKFISEGGAVSSVLGYRGYPESICTSVNNVAAHGVPDDNAVLQYGDIINVDVATKLGGRHGDTSRMYFVGNPSDRARDLCKVAYECMMRGIKKIRPGATVGDIGNAARVFIKRSDYSLAGGYQSHGIGEDLHQAPDIPFSGEKGKGTKLVEGMFLTVEPIVNLGGEETVKSWADGWPMFTTDGKWSAQFEHTVGVTRNGYEILTLSPEGKDHPNWTEIVAEKDLSDLKLR